MTPETQDTQERHWWDYWVAWLLFVLAAVVFSAFGPSVWNGYRLWQLGRRGVHVHARLTGKDTVSGRRTTYRVSYQFETADGRSWSGGSAVGPADVKDWQAALETVEVAYLAENPAANDWVVALTENTVTGLAGSVLLGLLALLLFCLGVKAARSPEAFWRWWAENTRR
jgi:hypothetical protein